MFIFALLPIIVILLGMVVMKKPAMIVSPLTLVFTVILSLTVFKSEGSLVLNQTYGGVIEGGKIIFLIWSAFSMLIMLQRTKAMDGIQNALANITDDKRILLIMIGFCFSIFLEGAAGAGTPTAICAPFLVGIGFSPLSAAMAGMLGAGIAPPFGGAGATTIVGTGAVADHVSLGSVTAMTGNFLMFGAIAVPFIMIYMLMGKNGFKGLVKYLLFTGVVCGLSMFIISNFIGPEIVSLGTGAIGVLSSFIYVKVTNHQTPEEFKCFVKQLSDAERREIPSTFKSFLPYILLIVALPAIRFSFPLATLAKYGYVMWIAVTIFVIVFIGAIILNGVKYYFKYVGEGLVKVIPALVSMASLLSVANIMKATGMLSIIAEGLAKTAGPVYPIVAVLIGSLGTFIAGTGLGSNVMFGPMHMQAADLLNINKTVTFACQNAGGGIGNMICPNNIVAASATVNTLGQEGEIMKKCLPSWLILVLIYGVLGMIYAKILFANVGL